MDRRAKATVTGLVGLGTSACSGTIHSRRLAPRGLLAGGILVALSLVAALSVSGAPAQAAFPGNNGKLVCFGPKDRPAADPDDDDYEIYTMNPDGTGRTFLTDTPVREPGDPASFYSDDNFPAVSADGTKVVFESLRSGSSELWRMNIDGTDVRRLTFEAAQDTEPTWSPDNTTVAWPTQRDGNYNIFRMKEDRSDQPGTRLTSDPGIDGRLAWSPDGTKIAFESNRDGNFDLYTMNPDGGDVTRLTDTSAPVQNRTPEWSPDGSQLLFQSTRDSAPLTTNYEIYKMNADGTGVMRLTTNEGTPGVRGTSLDQYAQFSPDGAKIVFESARDNDFEIYTMNPDGTAQTRITTTPGTDRGCDWQPIPIPRPASVQAPAQPQARDSRAPRVRASRACTSGRFRTRVRVDEPVRSVVVSLNGRRLLRTARASFTVRVPARRLRRGRVNRLTVVATDAAGNRSRRTFRLRACAAQRPRFTG